MFHEHVSRIEKEINFNWATANPALFVQSVKDFQAETPSAAWQHFLDLSRDHFMKLIAVRRDKPFDSVHDLLFADNGKQYLREIGMDLPPPATVPTAQVEVTGEGPGGSALTIVAQVPVPLELVVNAIVGAIEGGSTYWCSEFFPGEDDMSRTLKRAAHFLLDNGPWYSVESYWREGGKANLRFEKPTEDHPGTATIGLAELTSGLTVMARVAPQHFADLVNENDDATTHDVFIQCVLFGEIIYG